MDKTDLMPKASPSTSPSPSLIKRLLPISVLILGLILFFAFDLGRFISIGALVEHYSAITAWAAEHQALALASFFGLYVVAVAFSLPIASPLTLAGGAVLGYIAAPVIVLAATLGAFILFLAARGAFSNVLAQKCGPFMAKISEGFN